MPMRPLKESLKASHPLLVSCRLNNCAFYEGVISEEDGTAMCSHPHKKLYMDSGNCPLFHLDWQRKLRELGRDRT